MFLCSTLIFCGPPKWQQVTFKKIHLIDPSGSVTNIWLFLNDFCVHKKKKKKNPSILFESWYYCNFPNMFVLRSMFTPIRRLDIRDSRMVARIRLFTQFHVSSSVSAEIVKLKNEHFLLFVRHLSRMNPGFVKVSHFFFIETATLIKMSSHP